MSFEFEYEQFVRKPFIVDATMVTKENIEEIAKLVGELREDKHGDPYIQVNRNVVPGVYRVFPGYWMTRMGDNIRCYNKRVFANQFGPNSPEIENWVNYIRQAGSKDSEEVQVGEYGRIVETEEPAVPEENVVEPDHKPQVEVVVNGGNA